MEQTHSHKIIHNNSYCTEFLELTQIKYQIKIVFNAGQPSCELEWGNLYVYLTNSGLEFRISFGHESM